VTDSEPTAADGLPAPEPWHAFGAYFADALDLFRRIEPIRSLDLGPWSVFVALAGSWRRAGVSPGVDELVAASGCSRRTVFRALGDLQEAGLVRPVGSCNNRRYGTGAALDGILTTFLRDREPGRWRVPRLVPGATVALEEPTSLINKNKDLLSSFLGTTASRRVACAALAALHRVAYPDILPPRTFDPRDVALVERCSARGDWDAATLEQMHLDAIQGACRISSGPPRPVYIWGDHRHFLDHVRRGRAQREQDRPKPPPARIRRAPQEPPAPPEWVAQHMSAVLKRLEGRS
jgi:hypothetical protein